MLREDIIYGSILIIIILLFIKKEKAPTAIILLFLGLIIIFFTNDFTFGKVIMEESAQFRFYIPNLWDFLIGMLAAGIAQIFLTLTNVMVATISLIQDLFPDKSDRIDANGLASNMGAINAISPFFGGIPLCHGSGGLASQYAFGARTGGSMIFEGILEIILGIFFSGFLFNIFILFPKGILGAMLIYTAFLLGRIAFKEFQYSNLPIIIIIALICLFINITLGFLIGLVLYFIYKKFFIQSRSS
ncbi:MAG: putative sulfate/molybdate transporter [Candidatus Lokiarchaeota archaeon]|nr:putative sulfate/molybdate transporter [Candidatus Lokiarchaeota archaeon]